MEKIHLTGDKFDRGQYMAARQTTISIVEEMATKMEAGMSEDNAHELIKKMFQAKGISKFWHPTKIRFGKNTTKSFKELSDKEVRLKEDDIFFIDIGPIWNEHEGDFGRTFVMGNNQEHFKIKKASEEIFEQLKNLWKSEKLNGQNLYQEAQAISAKMGYELNMKMDGHRLGDFPHHVFYRGGLAEIETVPVPDIWILEILIRHKDLEIGAFFEDILF